MSITLGNDSLFRRMRRRGFAAAAAALLSGGLAPIPVLAQGDDSVKIGLILDMSGVYADISGKGTVTAAQLAIKDFGGTVLNRKIELLVADHQGKADIAATRAREWFDVRKLDAIHDVTGSSTALAVLNVAKEKDKIVVFNGPGSDRLTNDLCSAVSVHWAYDSYALANTVAKSMVRQGGKEWYFITADYAGGHDVERAAAAIVNAEGGKVLGSSRHPLGGSDFSSMVVQARSSKAQVIGLASFGRDLINIIKAAREFGVQPDGPQRLATLLMFINDVHGVGLPAAQGMVLAEGFYWDMNEETRAFAKRYFEQVNAMPNMSQAGTYSSVTHYLKAVQAAGTTETHAVMRKMRELPVVDFYTKNGRLREDGRMVHDMYLFQVKSRAESKYPWDYYKLLQVVPGDAAFKPLALSECPRVKKVSPDTAAAPR
jgi:branched-chain amino acid transport system substrate-binding protein